MNEQTAMEYSEILRNYTKIGWGIIVIVCIVFLVLLFLFIKEGSMKQKTVVVCLILLLMIAPIVYVTSVLPYQLDINQCNYEKFQGDFCIEDYYYATRNGTYIIVSYDGKKSVRYKAPADLNIEPKSVYSGEFVIAGYSKTIVYLSISEKQSEG